MWHGLLVAALVLIAVLIGCVFVLYQDARQKRLLRQLRLALPVSSDSGVEQEPSIRRQQPRRRWLRSLAETLFRYNTETPQTMRASRVVAGAVGVAVVAFGVAGFLLPVWTAPVVGVVAGMIALRGLFGWQQDRYADRLLRQLPDTIEFVVSAVRAGLPISEAFHGVAREMRDPTREQFGHVVSELALGRPVDEAVLNVYLRTHVAEYGIFATALSVQAKSGGRLAETIQTLADTVRQRVALAGRAKALAGEARFSARVLTGVPVVAGCGLSVIHPGYLSPLLDDPRGRLMAAYGIISLLLGMLTMRRMIKKGTAV